MRSQSSRMATPLSAFDLWELLGDEHGLSDYDILENQNDEVQPLHIAAAFNAVSSIMYIWDHSKRRKDSSTLVDSVQHPFSPLHRAVERGHLEAVQTLLQYASSELEFSHGLFKLVVNSSRIDLFDLLSARVELTAKKDILAMLRCAIKLDINEKVKELLDVDSILIHEKDKMGNTLLHLAADQGSVSMCALLLERAADPNQVNNRGETPLHCSCDKGHSGVAKLLINHANVNRENQDGRLALLLAAVA